jgi:hypothetical protein
MPPKQHDLSEVPEWARPIVEDYLARQAAERAAAEQEAADEVRRVAKTAVHMGHMANRPGENFRLAVRPRVTAVLSTPEQRHFEATRQARLREARFGNVVPPRPD